ncbi:MAG: cupin domain-containing protein [Chloroflexota bacterium]|nr:cupin domain-containing protein [Chloroflexota bacterium]
MVRKRKSLALSLALALALLGALAVMPSLGSNHIVFEPLTGRASFTDDVTLKFKIKLDGRATEVVNMRDPSLVQTAEITVQPGAMFPWHTHDGLVVVTVASGELVYVSSEDCVERSYVAGEAFVDPGHGHVHTAYNPSATDETVLVATFFGVAASGPLTIPAPAPDDCVVTP